VPESAPGGDEVAAVGRYLQGVVPAVTVRQEATLAGSDVDSDEIASTAGGRE